VVGLVCHRLSITLLLELGSVLVDALAECVVPCLRHISMALEDVVGGHVINFDHAFVVKQQVGVRLILLHLLNVAEAFNRIGWDDIADVLQDADGVPDLFLKDHLLGVDDSRFDPETCWHLCCIAILEGVL